ncbi:hypothetical protein K439DRAFT_1363592 [Ramaria rubella]|nr:hypothetical protein K439DRAFT_1363592 [Ramaria rubella]
MPIDVNAEVQHALQSGLPVVALETAIVTHGMPYPINLETALSVESKVRSAGSIPATIGLLNGRIVVGLQKAQLESLADPSNPNLVKLSRRDLAPAIGLIKCGGTTISATSLIASLVGIRVFATGGLGGVHRGGELSWDVSADLTELGRTPIAVVSAGVKSILDIGRTLEYLETQGVAVVTYGPTSEFPGFYGPRTGYQSPWRVNSPEGAASIINASQRLGIKSGILFAAPIPEEYAGPAETIQAAVELAIKESEENGMSQRGKEATPWILRRVADLTQGISLPSNIALIENTAQIGGSIAAEYAKLHRLESEQSNVTSSPYPCVLLTILYFCRRYTCPYMLQPPATSIVIGAAAIDVISQPTQVSTSTAQSTSPGRVTFSPGGVARNIAEAAHRTLSTSDVPHPNDVLLISPVGNDLAASFILDDIGRKGMRTDGLLTLGSEKQRSAVCNMQLDAMGNLMTGIADMSIVEVIDAAQIIAMIEEHQPKVVAFDANLSSSTLTSLVRFCNQRQIPSFFEPTSVIKVTSILPALGEMIEQGHFHSSPVTFASPNQLELSRLFHEARSSPFELTNKPYWWSVVDDLGLGETYRSDLMALSRQPMSLPHSSNLFALDGIPQMAISLLPFFQHLFIKCGDKGVFVVMRVAGDAALSSGWSTERTRPEHHQLVAKGKDSILVMKHYPALPISKEDIVNVTGAGDSFVGSLLAALGKDGALSTPKRLDDIMERAQHTARLSLTSFDAVSPLLQHASRSI